MKGKIDKNGFLYIERAGELKKQLCPYGEQNPSRFICGDWCPLFGEPYPYKLEKGGYATAVDICHTVLVFTEFKDERP